MKTTKAFAYENHRLTNVYPKSAMLYMLSCLFNKNVFELDKYVNKYIDIQRL